MDDINVKEIEVLRAYCSKLNDFKTGTSAVGLLVARQIDKIKDVIPTVIVLTSPVVRIYYKKLTEQFIPNITVLSYSEIDSTAQIQAIGNISLNTAAAPAV